MTRPTVILAEDHELMSQGLRTMLAPFCDVLATVADGAGVVSAVKEHQPDLLLLDLSLPNRSGIDLLGDLATLRFRPRVVVVTMHAERALADLALKLGALGFVPKDAGVEELRTAIDHALAGRRYVSPQLTPRSQAVIPDKVMGWSLLTGRQQQIVRMLAAGKTTEQIARRLGLTTHAIHYHRKNIRHRLGIQSDFEMSRYVMTVAMTDKR